MSNNVKVTVCCFAYNHEEYIRDALEGFVKQKTNFDYEVIVHDDASTDGTAKIIREYEEKYPDIIRPIYQVENQHSKNINKMRAFILPAARGKYIALCEGDDYWIDEDKLQLQYDYMEAHEDCSLVAHMALTYHMNGGYYTPYTSRSFATEEQRHISAAEIINKHTIFPTASMFVRTDYYHHNAEFLSGVRAFDYLSKALLATEGDVYVIPRVMSVYRLGSAGSWTNRIYKDANQLEKHFLAAVSTMEKLDEYREYKFHDAIEKNIEQRRFDAQAKLLNFKVLKKEPFKDKYYALSVKERALMHLQKYAPILHKLYNKITVMIKKFANRKVKPCIRLTERTK